MDPRIQYPWINYLYSVFTLYSNNTAKERTKIPIQDPGSQDPVDPGSGFMLTEGPWDPVLMFGQPLIR